MNDKTIYAMIGGAVLVTLGVGVWAVLPKAPKPRQVAPSREPQPVKTTPMKNPASGRMQRPTVEPSTNPAHIKPDDSYEILQHRKQEPENQDRVHREWLGKIEAFHDRLQTVRSQGWMDDATTRRLRVEHMSYMDQTEDVKPLIASMLIDAAFTDLNMMLDAIVDMNPEAYAQASSSYGYSLAELKAFITPAHSATSPPSTKQHSLDTLPDDWSAMSASEKLFLCEQIKKTFPVVQGAPSELVRQMEYEYEMHGDILNEYPLIWLSFKLYDPRGPHYTGMYPPYWKKDKP